MTDDDRYGRNRGRRGALLGLPLALVMFLVGGYWTLRSWGVFDGAAPSSAVQTLAPALAGLGVALAWVCLRPPQS